MPISSIEKVVASGTCVGCGACAVRSASIVMHRSQLGAMSADISSADEHGLRSASRVCPFSEDSEGEDEIGDSLFRAGNLKDVRIGYFGNIYAGRVIHGENLELSSSGGLTSWLLIQLMERGEIDGVVHVASSSASENGLFDFAVSRTVDEVRQRRKSQYYSVSMAAAVNSIIGDGRRYAFVGVPCFIKAIRLLGAEDPEFKRQTAVTIGLVCGHMKTSAFAESLAWQLGVEPDAIDSVDFRVKQRNAPSYEYAFQATSKSGNEFSSAVRDLVGTNWGHAFFQLKACDYCDDIFAETADIVFGDAWLKKYVRDWQGTNVVVCRNATLNELLVDGAKQGKIFIEELTVDDAVESQAGNFRHRWDGLSVRLMDDDLAGRWHPRKRISAGSRVVDDRRISIVRLRQEMARVSQDAFLSAKQGKDINRFILAVEPLVRKMDRLSEPFFRALIRKAVSALRRFFRTKVVHTTAP